MMTAMKTKEFLFRGKKETKTQAQLESIVTSFIIIAFFFICAVLDFPFFFGLFKCCFFSPSFKGVFAIHFMLKNENEVL